MYYIMLHLESLTNLPQLRTQHPRFEVTFNFVKKLTDIKVVYNFQIQTPHSIISDHLTFTTLPKANHSHLTTPASHHTTQCHPPRPHLEGKNFVPVNLSKASRNHHQYLFIPSTFVLLIENL